MLSFSVLDVSIFLDMQCNGVLLSNYLHVFSTESPVIYANEVSLFRMLKIFVNFVISLSAFKQAVIVFKQYSNALLKRLILIIVSYLTMKS